jgi:hypothetical protein
VIPATHLTLPTWTGNEPGPRPTTDAVPRLSRLRPPLPAGDRRPRLGRQRVRIGLREVVGIDAHECEAARDLEAGEAVLPAVAALAMREPERLVLSGPGLKSLLPCLATSESLDRDHQGGTAGNSIGYPHSQ